LALKEPTLLIRAVLFDVGGPLDMEVEHERLIDQDIRAAFAAASRSVTDEEYAAAARHAVECFAWNTYHAIIWELAGGSADLARRVNEDFRARADGRNVFELRPGMDALLRRLHERGLKLGLAANQPAAALERLDAAGVGHYFHYRHVSSTHGFYKPDPRLFLHACEALAVSPQECIMAGDRIDNDIAPARALGMRTVLLRTGRHIAQQPRTRLELPDAEVFDVAEMEAAILTLAQLPRPPRR
jgi:HAD superfamily hydrolase (TIGR01549 family)